MRSGIEIQDIISHQPPVYWVEADEEANLLAPRNPEIMARRSLLAYLLLRRTVIAHPADFWQSSQTNRLMLNKQAQPLLRDVIRIHLGASESIQDYMQNRVEKLKQDRASFMGSLELQQYEKYQTILNSQAEELDSIFTCSGATLSSNYSRDKKFRKLIRDDLSSEVVAGPQLGGSIRQVLRKSDADRVIKTLIQLTHDRRRFLSIDGIIFRLMAAKCPVGMIDSIFRRLQLLQWEARKHGNIDVPFLTRTATNKLDPSDPEVFWTAIDHLVGPEFQKAMISLPWQTAVYLSCALRVDKMWADFIATYEVIVETVERDHKCIAEELVTAKASARYPTLLRIALNTKPDKWTTLSWVCHAGSWLAGIPNDPFILFRFGSLLVAINKGLEHACKIKDALFASERQLLKSRIKRMIDDATRTS